MSVPPKKILRWKQAAIDDLAKILKWIAEDSPAAAERFRAQILDEIVTLASFPLSGGICDQYPKARQLIFDDYVIYYTVTGREVVIRAVVHGARHFRPSWLRRK